LSTLKSHEKVDGLSWYDTLTHGKFLQPMAATIRPILILIYVSFFAFLARDFWQLKEL
jgi:hypothetical protein